MKAMSIPSARNRPTYDSISTLSHLGHGSRPWRQRKTVAIIQSPSRASNTKHLYTTEEPDVSVG